MALENWYAANDVPSPTEPRYSSWVNQQKYWFGDDYVNALLEARQIADKDLFFRAYSEPNGFESVENTVAAYKENRDKFLKDNAVEISSNLIFGNEQQGLTDFGKFLYSKGVDPTSIQNIFNSGANQVRENAAILAKWTAFEQRGSGFERFAPIIATFVAPVLAPSVAAALSVSTSTAAAVVTTAVQIAAGVDPEKAIQNAITSAVVQTGSAAAATEINSAISKVVENKELAANLSNAAGSALASAATAAAKGGSTSDIIESALAGAAGSATTAATGEAALGGAVSGGILGGVEGALAGAAGAIGREAAKPEAAAPVAEAPATSADPGVQVAGGDDASALKLAQVSAMPEMLGRQGETSGPITAITTDEGNLVYRRVVTGKTPDGQEYGYTVTYDPSFPTGKQFQYEFGGVGDQFTETVVKFEKPNFSGAEELGAGTAAAPYTPDITVAGAGYVAPDVSGAGADGGVPPLDQQILDLIGQTGAPTAGAETGAGAPAAGGAADITVAGGGAAGGVPSGTPGGAGVTPGAETGIPGAGTAAGVGTATGAGVGEGAGTGGAGEAVSGPVTPEVPVEPIAEAPEEPVDATEREGTLAKETPATDQYKPSIRTTYTASTKPRAGAQSTLAQVLQGQYYPLSTTGLTAYRPAGEIESEESGKGRQDVWNEASLRLKDALGL